MKVLAYTVPAAGHQNAVIGLCQTLLARNHEIHFIIDPAFKGKLAKFGFEEILLNRTPKAGENAGQLENPIKYFAKIIKEKGFLSNKSPLEKMKESVCNDVLMQSLVEIAIEDEPQVKQAIQQVQPDVILVDTFQFLPSFTHGSVPWVLIWSPAPIMLFESKKLPPAFLGLPTDNFENIPNLEEYTRLSEHWCQQTLDNENKILAHFGYPPVDRKGLVPKSPYLNIYGYPKELDYTDLVPMPENTIHVDAFNWKTPEPYQFPVEFQSKIKEGDKLVYISMGSMGSIDVQLMKRILNSLADTPHKYVVSKGPLADEYDLPENMWGEGYLPQTSILPLVDLVITHGGNNTTTETICAGKPMIVMPLFGDQFENAQRVHEKGYGIRINPFDFKPHQLVEAVERLLADNATRQRTEATAKRIAQSDSKLRACIALEELVQKHQQQ